MSVSGSVSLSVLVDSEVIRTSDVASVLRRLLCVQLLLPPGLQNRVLVLRLTVNVTETRDTAGQHQHLQTDQSSADSNHTKPQCLKLSQMCLVTE